VLLISQNLNRCQKRKHNWSIGFSFQEEANQKRKQKGKNQSRVHIGADRRSPALVLLIASLSGFVVYQKRKHNRTLPHRDGALPAPMHCPIGAPTYCIASFPPFPRLSFLYLGSNKDERMDSPFLHGLQGSDHSRITEIILHPSHK
jgi:hypothetical protein